MTFLLPNPLLGRADFDFSFSTIDSMALCEFTKAYDDMSIPTSNTFFPLLACQL